MSNLTNEQKIMLVKNAIRLMKKNVSTLYAKGGREKDWEDGYITGLKSCIELLEIVIK
jgi:hypothetical protein